MLTSGSLEIFAHLRILLEPLLRRGRVTLAWLVVMLRNFAITARVGAYVTAVIADDGLRGHDVGKVLAALLAKQLVARQHLRTLEYVERATVLASRRFEGRRLAFSAHGIAYPTSTRHDASFRFQVRGFRNDNG